MTDSRPTVRVLKLNDATTLVVRQQPVNSFFLVTNDGFIISIENLAFLLKYMIFTGILSPKVLEGILSEFDQYRN